MQNVDQEWAIKKVERKKEGMAQRRLPLSLVDKCKCSFTLCVTVLSHRVPAVRCSLSGLVLCKRQHRKLPQTLGPLCHLCYVMMCFPLSLSQAQTWARDKHRRLFSYLGCVKVEQCLSVLCECLWRFWPDVHELENRSQMRRSKYSQELQKEKGERKKGINKCHKESKKDILSASDWAPFV